MMGPDCRLERLEPTSVIALLSDGCKKAVRKKAVPPSNLSHREEIATIGPSRNHGRTDVTDGYRGIKHWIGTTRVNSSVGPDCRGTRLEPMVTLLEGSAKGFVKGFSEGFAKGFATGFPSIHMCIHREDCQFVFAFVFACVFTCICLRINICIHREKIEISPEITLVF